MHPRPIGGFAGIDFFYEVALADPADGGVARQLADGVDPLGDQGGPGAGPGGGRGGLAARVSSPDDDDVVVVFRV